MYINEALEKDQRVRRTTFKVFCVLTGLAVLLTPARAEFFRETYISMLAELVTAWLQYNSSEKALEHADYKRKIENAEKPETSWKGLLDGAMRVALDESSRVGKLQGSAAVVGTPVRGATQNAFHVHVTRRVNPGASAGCPGLPRAAAAAAAAPTMIACWQCGHQLGVPPGCGAGAKLACPTCGAHNEVPGGDSV